MVRVSPGSPSQWKATLSPRPASTWRSTQLYAAFSSPPTNHFANGGFDQSRTVFHLVFQCRRSACLAQKDRKSGVEGKSVDLGGRRIIKKKKKKSEREV